MLLFKKKFLDAIRDGRKTQTIRLWKFARMRAGQRSYIPGVGYIRIEQVEPVTLEQLTEEDALRDGFPSAESLRLEIEQLYPEREAKHRPFRIRFTVLPPEEQKKREKKQDAAAAGSQEAATAATTAPPPSRQSKRAAGGTRRKAPQRK